MGGVHIHRRLAWSDWPESVRQARGLLNGDMVRLAYQSRGMLRAALARKVGLPVAVLRTREVGWHFWTPREYAALQGATDYPPHFFTANESADGGAAFACNYDPDEGRYHCIVRDEGDGEA